ncbi:MobH family relaxase [Pseudomonas synxantha]|uniref:Integrating conjugative element relaxase (TIGR03760 family) n=1 Tax=Pseudomonas synxantha TaxID=47883 RepID=A0ACC6JS12_9PSED|nr:MobH family relaxase [Pseudomonas synxantha]MDR6609047.1 integrating conjugative element relaxase (TIGR03760 family) [Pseudomonas synxantha]
MLTLFHRKQRSNQNEEPSEKRSSSRGLTAAQSAHDLLAAPRRQKLLDQIWQRTALSRPQFNELYLDPIKRYAELVQLLPASESHHHAYSGGMLDHGLEVVAYALKLRQSHLLPSGAQPETQIAQAEAWTAGIAYGALVHDLGKISVDVHVEYADGTIWHPWHGPLARPYRLRYRKDRQYRLHGAAAGMLICQLLNRNILDWLCTFPELWAALLYNLAGQSEYAGELGSLVMQADQASVSQALGGDPGKALTAPKHALQRKLLEGLRYLLCEELKLNQPQASDGWLTHDALWLVSKTVSDKLRAHLLSQGIDGIPEKNTAVFNVLQDHGIAQPNRDDKAIWKATVTSENGWSHSFTFLKLSPALIWESGARPLVFSGSVTVDDDLPTTFQGKANTASEAPSPDGNKTGPARSIAPPPTPPDSVDLLLDLFGAPPPNLEEPDDIDNLESPNTEIPSAPTPTNPSGDHFMQWFTKGIQTHRIIMNDTKALVHSVNETLYLVTPGIFRRYGQEHPHLARIAKQEGLSDWQWIQKRFEQMKLHRKQPNGLNIWTCEVTGPRKSRRLHGYLLKSPGGLMNELALNNPYLKVVTPGSSEEVPSTSGNTR